MNSGVEVAEGVKVNVGEGEAVNVPVGMKVWVGGAGSVGK
jgi:hypothetical protein